MNKLETQIKRDTTQVEQVKIIQTIYSFELPRQIKENLAKE